MKQRQRLSHPRAASTTVLAAALSGALLAGGPAAPTEAAAPRPAPASPRTLVDGLVGPLSLAVGDNGTRWFSQNFAGLLMRQRPGGEPQVVLSVRRAEIGAVSVRRRIVTFAISRGNNEKGVIKTLRPGGTPRILANLGRAERRRNPDGAVRYGFVDPVSDACAARLPRGVRRGYRGIAETHPYATVTGPGGTTYVADAGANALWGIAPSGTVRAVAVLPPVEVRITRSLAEQNGIPACAVGRRYAFESVPTDVEIGPKGGLFVSTLAGGPESPGTATGGVYRVDPVSGRTASVVSGLTSATGLSVAPDGDVYVSELFTGRIVRIPANTRRVTTFARLPLPGDVEVGPTGAYATSNVLPGEDGPPDGRLVRLRR